MSTERDIRVRRRALMCNGVLILASSLFEPRELLAEDDATTLPDTKLRIGLVTDLHYADKPPAGTRHYRETLGKLDEAAQHFSRRKLDFVVELGDIIDAAPSVSVEQRYLKTVNEAFSQVCSERHYVLGNHCVDTLTKQEFLKGVGQEKTYYSFDRDGYHFIVLDACFRSDGQPYERRNFEWTDANVPRAEIEWLKADLRANGNPVVVFAHQRLDVANNHGVKNNAEVRKILEDSGNVQVVFQGHSHKNDLKRIGGIHYCTLVAMVEGSGESNNGYSVMEIDDDDNIRITGFRNQHSHRWPALD